MPSTAANRPPKNDVVNSTGVNNVRDSTFTDSVENDGKMKVVPVVAKVNSSEIVNSENSEDKASKSGISSLKRKFENGDPDLGGHASATLPTNYSNTTKASEYIEVDTGMLTLNRIHLDITLSYEPMSNLTHIPFPIIV